MHQTEAPAPAQCPIEHNAPSKPAACPVPHDAPSGVNPLNQMPVLSQSRASNQSSWLPTSRTTSSIPRDGEGNWEYPSPQQFHNALERKGMETPEEHVETMVQIHNFLNEQAWQEVLKWEKRQNRCLYTLRLTCKIRTLINAGTFQHPHGPAAGPFQRATRRDLTQSAVLAFRWLDVPVPLQVRSVSIQEVRAFLTDWTGSSEAPFDRHDWIVRRPGSGEEVRYVIDYYSAPPEPDGSPVFSLDVRPALDSVSSIKERIVVATEEAWSTFADREPELGARRDNAARAYLC